MQYGPIVLARDERLDPKYDQPVSIRTETDGTVTLRRIMPAPGGARIAFAVSTADGEIVMTDYASVDCWNGSHVCTWMKRGPSGKNK